jgi:DNA-binding GntR family transcriptional regulator
MTYRQPTGRSSSTGSVDGQELLPRANIKQAVADHVRKLIFGGTLKPHERVPQDEIAASLGVSRLPVREALFTLETEGLVYLEPRRGAFVSPLDKVDVLDHYEMFGLIHGLAASRAAGLLDDDALRHLEEVNARLEASEDPVEQDALNWEFHRTINRVGGSRRLHVVLRTLARNIPRNFFGEIPRSKPTAVRAHRRILEALRARDGEAAARACRDHLREEGDLIVQSMEQEGRWDGEGRAVGRSS